VVALAGSPRMLRLFDSLAEELRLLIAQLARGEGRRT
jgi:hypothetical protein